MARAIIVVLDSFGCGEAPDADKFGDKGANTLRSCTSSSYMKVPNLTKLGMYNIDGIDCGTKDEAPIGAYAKCREVSMGKDTTTGHWEMAGIISEKPMPTYPDGFPEEVLKPFIEKTGRGVLVNKPYSGTAVIEEYGDEMVKTGKWIVYTSADSVFQIAAHEEVVPLEELYEACRTAREILQGDHAVGRVIARPFIGANGKYERTPHRHDFSLLPKKPNLLSECIAAGKEVLAVGKIHDIFAGQDMTEYVYTESNADGIDRTIEWMDKDFDGLLFTNLVDTDMIFGHRRDIDGYAKAIAYFDEKLPVIMDKMKEDDILIITADHGCDPGYTAHTDHTREYIPMLCYGKTVPAGNRGTREGFADIAATVCEHLGIKCETPGVSFLKA